jgi:YD repeat-containing protein
MSFTYDANGNTLAKVDSSGTTTYGWDFETQLTSLVLPGAGGTVTFKYDPFGRRIQKSSSSGTTNYLYDAGCPRLSALNSVTQIQAWVPHSL